MSLPTNDTFGAFRLIKELGSGATGTVYLAEQTNLGRECALKVLAPELVRDQTFLERFRREGKIAASLRHPSIVRIFDLVEADSGFALAMDFIEGQELRQLLESEGKLPKNVALDIIGKVLDALDYAHNKGVVHRDIKPANILIEKDGSVFLTDFSIARMAGAEKLTRTGTVIGTPEYMAPEQFDGKDVDARADVYATALILYELLTGINPFQGDTLAEIVKKQIMLEPPDLGELVDVPPALVELVHRGLQKSPEERFQSASEMSAALKALGQPVGQASGSLTQFLSSVELGAISMDDAVTAREKVKEAIDRGFKRRLTIVMLDLAGSSKIKIPNQTLIADRAFQDYRGTINKILEEHGCERYDWSGDGAISLFPEPGPAVDAAVLVQKKVSEVGGRHKELPDALLVRIGIRTGMVYYDPRRTLGEFASRTVDQAGHLEKDCPPGAIRLGDETVKALDGRYQTVSIGMNRDDIEVFEIRVGTSALATEKGAETNQMEPEPPRPAPQPAAPAASPPPSTETKDMPAVAPPKQKPTSTGTPLFTPRAAPPPPKKTTKEMASVAQPQKAPVTSGPFQPKPQPGEPELSARQAEQQRPHEKAEIADEGPWWGWRSMGLFFFLWGSTLFVNKAIPGVTIPFAAKRLFSSIFAIQLCLTPMYSLFLVVQGDTPKAKTVAKAGGAFLFGTIVLALLFGDFSHLNR